MSEARQLRPAQKVAARWLLTHPRGGLFLPMGFGKTFTLITVLAALGWPRTLVVAPRRVAMETWPAELDAVAPLQVLRHRWLDMLGFSTVVCWTQNGCVGLKEKWKKWMDL